MKIWKNIKTNRAVNAFPLLISVQKKITLFHGCHCSMKDKYSSILLEKKPAAQAAGADPSRCNSSNRQTQPTSANLLKPMTQQWDWDVLLDIECPKLVRHSLFYDWRSYLKPFGRGGFINSWEEKDELVNELINQWQRCL